MITRTFDFKKVIGTNNGYFIRNGFRAKNQDASLFEMLFERSLLNESFKLKDEYVCLSIEWLNPNYYTKKGKLHSRCGDIDGPLKFIIDGVCKGLRIDDSCIKDLKIVQLPADGEVHKITVEIDKKPLLKQGDK